ncbi:MAG: sugar transferase [Gammaproteobacteria bacterium]|nr:sugar transferase [Gammaproteobacteria bacterium]
MYQYQTNFIFSIKSRSFYSKNTSELQSKVKRTFDVLAAVAAIILLSPIFIIIALLIRLESKGGALFKQERVGQNGRSFTMYKFRSMRTDAEARLVELENSNEMESGVIFKMKSDPRITKVGKFIRKASIDELPQLFNVLIGDMSLVGPRPPLPKEVVQYSQRDFMRLAAVPGITCFWQVMGRSDIPFKQQVELDIKYIKNQSFLLDVKLLLMTVPAVLTARGAY